MRTRERVTGWAAVVVVAAAVLLLGAAPRWAQAITALAAGAAVATSFSSRRTFTRPPWLSVTLGVALVLCLVQLIPLPQSLLERLSSEGAMLRVDGAALAKTSPWTAITLDAPGTLRAACFFAILLAFAHVALRVSVQERGRYFVLAGIAGVCALTAVIVGAHAMLGSDALYGIYTPRQAHPSVLGPLLNENHLGGLMAMGTLLAGGLLMVRGQRSWVRASWTLVAAACGAVTVASHSRGATLALLFGALVFGAILAGQRFTRAENERRSTLRTSLPVAIVALCAVLVIIYASAGRVTDELSRTSLDEVNQPLSKFAVWRASGALIDEAPWFGVGRGAFEPAFTRIHAPTALVSYSHVENEYVQVLVDWGVIGAGLLAIAGVLVAVAAIRRWREGPLAAGALAALVAIGAQSVVDFGAELLGLAVPIVGIAATLTYVPLKEVSQRRLVASRAARAAYVIGAIAAALLLLSRVTTTIDEDHRALAGVTSLDDPTLHDVIERHPLDYYGFSIAAEVAGRSGDASAVSLLNHALRLHPYHPGLHHLAARMLVRAKRFDQAALEYAIVLRSTVKRGPVLTEMLARLPADVFADRLPLDGIGTEELAKNLLAVNAPIEAMVRWLVRVLEVRPGEVVACHWLYTLGINPWNEHAAAEAVKHCDSTGMANEERLLLARGLLRAGKFDEVLRSVTGVETWTGRRDTKVHAWLLGCEAHLGAGHTDEARQCLHAVDRSGLATPADLQQIETLRARMQPGVTAPGGTAAPPP